MADHSGYRKAFVFALTFISYGLYHASRKTLSGVKKSMMDEWTSNGTHNVNLEDELLGGNKTDNPFFPSKEDANTFLGFLDAVFMGAYAAALFFWGCMGDRYNPRNVVTIGMVFSAITLTAFGAIPHFAHFYSIPYYILTYLAFGIVQACGWPSEVAIMANWFGKTNRGLVMGFWSSCQPIGNIVGAIVISLTLRFGYQYTFVVNSAIVLIGGVFFFFFIQPSPKSHERSEESSRDLEENESSDDEEDVRVLRDPLPLSLWQALFLPNVLPYCLCNACLKFVNYAFFFWLPFYLAKNFGWDESEANQLATWYDVGGIIGSIVGGIASDRLGHRSPVIVTMLITSLFTLFVYSELGDDKLLNSLVMVVLGFTISGPYNLIVGTISIDLGSQPELHGNLQAMSTVSGIIDGTGSAGSAIGQLVVPIVQNSRVGWSGVFYLFIVMNALSVFCLARRFFLDVALLKRAWQQRHDRESEPLLSPTGV